MNGAIGMGQGLSGAPTREVTASLSGQLEGILRQLRDGLNTVALCHDMMVGPTEVSATPEPVPVLGVRKLVAEIEQASVLLADRLKALRALL